MPLTREDRLVKDCFRRGDCTPIVQLICDPTCTPQHFQRVLDRHSSYTFLNCDDPDANVTPLLLVACRWQQSNQVGICKVLLQPKYQVDIHQRAATGSQPIMAAAETGSPEVAQLLIEKGADILSRNPNHPSTPLDLATQNNHCRVVAHLINAAIDQNRQEEIFNTHNSFHQSALQAAMYRRRSEIVGMMAQAGADLRYGFHVLWAIDPDHPDKVDYMDPNPTKSSEHWGLYKTVYAFVTHTCAHCRESPADRKQLNVCSRCRMAQYCSPTCQKEDWSTHKKCCKKLTLGKNLIGKLNEEGVRENQRMPPPPCKEAAGFVEPWDPEVNAKHDSYLYDADSHPVWEYQTKETDGSLAWKRYPPMIEGNIECLLDIGGPRYMYRPNHPECEGNHESCPFGKTPMPEVSTRFLYFTCMMEFDVYTGAARAVRRNGEIKLEGRTFDTQMQSESDLMAGVARSMERSKELRPKEWGL